MEFLEQKVCLDTDAVISILNKDKRAIDLLEVIAKYEVSITTINLFELLLRENNLDKIEIFRSKVKVMNFDEASCRKASLISKDLKKTGKQLEFRDIFIASVCIVNNCELLTFNKKHFERLKEFGLTLIN